ncbi:MAG: WbqC family protein [Planctomycetota bacterium]
MKTIAILQPHYLPWIGYFEMIDRVDEFWLFDDVDFIKREWKNRNRIRGTADGSEPKWLSVPIERACQRGTPIAEARLASDVDWRRRHRDAFDEVYRHAPHHALAAQLLEAGLAREARTLAELNAALLEVLCGQLGIQTPLRRTSTLAVEGAKTERLIAVCRAVGATAYLANDRSSDYLQLERFAEAGIEIEYQGYAHPEYVQRSRGRELPFLSHLSVLDLIANQGEDALSVIRAGRGVHR